MQFHFIFLEGAISSAAQGAVRLSLVNMRSTGPYTSPGLLSPTTVHLNKNLKTATECPSGHLGAIGARP
jgi:hypothetical protein